MAEWLPIESIPDEFKDGRYVVLWARQCGFPNEDYEAVLARYSEIEGRMKAINGEPATGWLSAIGTPTNREWGGMEYDDLIPSHWQPWPDNGPQTRG